MVKGEYDFAILVTCLLILALQIHNPFQSPRQSPCVSADSQTSAYSAEKSFVQPAAPAARATRGQPAAPPETRRPREAATPVARPGGLSTDDLLRELDSIQVKAKEQQDTLAANGRMPPSSPILEQLRETEGLAVNSRGGAMAGRAATAPPTAPVLQSRTDFGGAAPMSPTDDATGPVLQSRTDFGRFLEARQPRGLGVVLGVGRGDFALRLLSDWGSSQGLYLVDPFIHIWRGYDDPSNIPDRDHQVQFEELRNRLAPFEGRHVLVRDFSHSFAEAYTRPGQAPGAPTFVYIDANHAEQAIARDLALWWPLLAPGGILAGSTYLDDAAGTIRVKAAVDKFATGNGLKVYLTHEDMPPSWFILKQ